MSVRSFRASSLKAVALLLLSAGLVVGVILSNLYFQEYLQMAGSVGSSLIRRLSTTSCNRAELFVYLLRTRLCIVIVLIFVGSRAWGVVVSLAYCVWMGFSAGMVMALAVIQGGVTELLYMLVLLLPQALLYIPAWCLLYEAILCRSSNETGGLKRYRLLVTIVLLLFVVGILLETFVSPLLISRLADGIS